MSHRPVGHESRRTPESFDDNDIVFVIIIIIIVVRLSVYEAHRGASINITYASLRRKTNDKSEMRFYSFPSSDRRFCFVDVFFLPSLLVYTDCARVYIVKI